MPIRLRRSSRYARTSSRNRSPKAIWSTPARWYFSRASSMRRSYTSLLHCCGITTSSRPYPNCCACSTRSSRRTPCMLTRSWPSVTVVNRAAIPVSRRRVSSRSARAESFPPLHASTTLFFTRPPVSVAPRHAPRFHAVGHHPLAPRRDPSARTVCRSSRLGATPVNENPHRTQRLTLPPAGRGGSGFRTCPRRPRRS
jgi:hypothetical protein